MRPVPLRLIVAPAGGQGNEFPEVRNGRQAGGARGSGWLRWGASAAHNGLPG
jgi:hypothetical protein